MEKGQTEFTHRILNNIRKILAQRDLKQVALSISSDVSEKTLSKILNGDQVLTVDHLHKIATGLSLREIDLLTWPDHYVLQEDPGVSPTEVLIQMRLTKEKKDQVLKLVFGENNIEILNK